MESHPQKEKVERYAESFRKLADTFYGMPYRKDYLSSGQVEKVLQGTNDRMCSNCYHREICWGEQAGSLYQGGAAMVRALEEGKPEEVEKIRKKWAEVCGKSVQYLENLKERFQQEKQNLVWGNRMIENRLAVAQQLTEMARIMEMVAEDLYDIYGCRTRVSGRNTQKSEKKRHIVVRQVWVMDRTEGTKTDFSYHACQKRTVRICDRSFADSVGNLRMCNDIVHQEAAVS